MAEMFSHQIKDSEEKYYLTASLPEFRSASQRFFPFPMAVSLEKEPDLLYLATLSRRLSRPGDMWACMLRYVDLRLAARRTVDAAAYELWDQAFCAVTEPRRRDLAFLKPVIRRLERHFNVDHATGSSVGSSPSVEGGSVSGGSVSGESVSGGSVAGGGDGGGDGRLGDGRRGGSRNQGNSNSATPLGAAGGRSSNRTSTSAHPQQGQRSDPHARPHQHPPQSRDSQHSHPLRPTPRCMKQESLKS